MYRTLIPSDHVLPREPKLTELPPPLESGGGTATLVAELPLAEPDGWPDCECIPDDELDAEC
ncbi:MAG TPA: hypothetical protein VF771_17580 [Longimicrobiaceae bacterium]